MYLTNDIGNSDSSNVIVELIGSNILLHIREIDNNGIVKCEARISMDRYLVTKLIGYLTTNKPETKTHTELWEDRKISK